MCVCMCKCVFRLNVHSFLKDEDAHAYVDPNAGSGDESGESDADDSMKQKSLPRSSRVVGYYEFVEVF